ncbi:hypothetical protein GCM10027157_20260 [Corynebacterium aquatimens]
MTQITWLYVAPKDSLIAGMATDTMDPSTRIMKNPSIIVHRAAHAERGEWVERVGECGMRIRVRQGQVLAACRGRMTTRWGSRWC